MLENKGMPLKSKYNNKGMPLVNGKGQRLGALIIEIQF